MAKATKLIAHPKHLSGLRLRSESDIDETITRLSYFTRQELEGFFSPMVNCGVEVGWRNEAEFPREATLFKNAMASVADGSSDNRDELLFALAQIVCGNLAELVKAYRRGVVTAFYRIIAKGEMPAEEYGRMLGEAGCEIGMGIFALCRISPDTARASVPQFIREAMGIMQASVLAPVKAVAAEPRKIVEAAVPASEVGLLPQDVARMWVQGLFVRGLSDKEAVQNSDIKTFAAMSAIPPLPGEKAPDVKRAVSSAKLFLLIQDDLMSFSKMSRKERASSDFPQCLRLMMDEIGNKLALPLVVGGASHLGGVSYGLNTQALKAFYSRIGNRMRECKAGEWYNIKDVLEDIESVDGEFQPMVSRYDTRLYNTYRQMRKPGYLASRPDMLLDLELPLARLLFSALALFGVVSVGVGREPTARQRYSQHDSAESFSLTPMGEYALGLTDKLPEYEPYVVEKCRLDEEYPFIYVPESMGEVYAPYLKKFGRPIGPARYAVSPESFTKGIRSREALGERIERFREFVGGELPQVWRELLDRINTRAHSAKVSRTYFTSLELDPENEELLDFVLHNSYIAETCVRGENYKLFVPVSELDIVVSEFASAGYLLN